MTRVPTPADPLDLDTASAQVGIFIDGSAMMDPEDGQDYNGWYRLAGSFEFNDFDGSWGHSTASNVYHHHIANLEYIGDGSVHSPIFGIAADGYPVYGPYGYSDSLDANSSIQRMESSYQIIEQFVIDGNRFSEDVNAPNVTVNVKKDGSSGPLGSYRQDYEYVQNSGTLDDHNGRWCVTPEYPSGTYAYFTTLDSDGNAAYPYHVGFTFYGEKYTEKMKAGFADIPTDAVQYVPVVTSLDSEKSNEFSVIALDNYLHIQGDFSQGDLASIISVEGVIQIQEEITSNELLINTSSLLKGTYIVKVHGEQGIRSEKVIIN